MGFRVGERVICIRSESSTMGDDAIKGEHYTVVSCLVSPHVADAGKAGVYLAEISKGPNPWHGKAAYHAENFRPLQETGMSILYGLLKTKSEKELVE